MISKEIRLLLPAAGRHLPYVVLGVLVLIILLCAYLFKPSHKIMATCKDGTVSYSNHRSGTCARHGGVHQWAKGIK